MLLRPEEHYVNPLSLDFLCEFLPENGERVTIVGIREKAVLKSQSSWAFLTRSYTVSTWQLHWIKNTYWVLSRHTLIRMCYYLTHAKLWKLLIWLLISSEKCNSGNTWKKKNAASWLYHWGVEHQSIFFCNIISWVEYLFKQSISIYSQEIIQWSQWLTTGMQCFFPESKGTQTTTGLSKELWEIHIF